MEVALVCLVVVVAFVLWGRIDDLDRRWKFAAEEIRDLRESLTKVQATLANVLAQSRGAAAAAPETARPETARSGVEPGPAVAAAVAAPPAPEVQATPTAAPASSSWTPTHRIPRGGLDAWPLPNSPRPPIGALPGNLEVAVQSWSGGWALVVTETGWRGWVDGVVLIAIAPESAAWACRQCGYGGNRPTAVSCFNCGARKGAVPAVPSRVAAAPVSWPAASTREKLVPEKVPAQPEYGPLQQFLIKLGLTPPAAGESWSRSAIEEWLEGRMLAIVGGIALLLGAAFFLSLAFSRGWISEELRVGTGLVVGAGMLVIGELAFSRLRGIVGHVLVAIGLATISLALFAATPRMYNLIPVELALLGIFVAAIFAAVTAVRHDSEIIAAFGLIAVLASPPVLGASPSLVTLLFIAATLVGTTGVALYRTWPWLPTLAFVLAAPQFAYYINGGPPVEQGLVAVAGFWLVNLVAAGGEELRHSTDRLRTATVTLLLADAAVTLWAGFTVLSGTLTEWRGTFLVVQAVAYLALALVYFVRNNDRHPFGLMVAATGVASLTMAIPIQFGGPPVPIAWAAEAVAVAWVAVVRRHPYSALVSLVLAVLALGHFLSLEYAPSDLAAGFSRSVPFVGPEGMTFGFMIGALAVAALIVPIGWVRAGLGVVAGLVALYVFPFEVAGPALVAGWAALAVVGLVAYARIVMPRITPDFHENRVPALGLPKFIATPLAEAVSSLSNVVRPSFLLVATGAGTGAIAHLASFEYPASLFFVGTPHEIPFVGLPGLAFAIVLVAILATGLLVPVTSTRIGLTALAGLIAFYVFPFELAGRELSKPALAAAWTALATGEFFVEALIIQKRVGPTLATPSLMRYMRPAVRAVGALTGLAVLAHLLVRDFPIDQLAQRAGFGQHALSNIPYAGTEGLSLAAALAGLAAVGVVMGARWIRLGIVGIGAALLIVTVTFEVDASVVAVPWGLLVLASIVVVRRIAPVDLVPKARGPVFEAGELLESASERLPYASAVLALILLLARSIWLADIESFGRYVTGDLALSGTPFFDQRTFVLLILAATLLVSGWIWRGVMPLVLGGVAAAGAIAWLLPFEIRPGYAVAGWSALALVGFLWLRIVPSARELLGWASLALAAAGAVVALAVVAPPDRLVVVDYRLILGWSLWTDATVAFGALALALGAGGLLHREDPLRRPVLLGAGVAAVYLLSVAVVDQFQFQVGSQPLEALQKSAQVGLSVLWSVLGAAGFVAGLAAHRPPIRLSGLGLLGLATTKVFVVDLAALDVSYRVLSLVALGFLLLVSAAVYSRMQHPPSRSHRPAPS